MSDMSHVIVPKSDQKNADDFFSGPQTFTISDVQIRGGQEQPVSIFVGDDKPYKPCKSMARVIVHAWGLDARQYIGRQITFYRDPNVKWGGMAVGGIRISHMSHIDREFSLALTETKGSRKPFTVKPLKIETQRSQPEARSLEQLCLLAQEVAPKGVKALEALFTALAKDEKAALKPELDRYKVIAREADDARQPGLPAPAEGWMNWGSRMSLDLNACDSMAELAEIEQRHLQYKAGYEAAMPSQATALVETFRLAKEEILAKAAKGENAG